MFRWKPLPIRLQFGLATLLVVMTAIAIGADVLGSRMRERAEADTAVGALKSRGFWVTHVLRVNNVDPRDRALYRLGLISSVSVPNRLSTSPGPITISEEDTRNICRLTQLTEVDLSKTNADDRLVMQLASLPDLKRLYLWQTRVTDQGMAEFQRQRPEVIVRW